MTKGGTAELAEAMKAASRKAQFYHLPPVQNIVTTRDATAAQRLPTTPKIPPPVV